MKRITLLIALGCGFALFCIVQVAIDHPAISAFFEHKPVEYGRPARIKIPKINVNATIVPMGLTQEGDMQAPSKQQDAGWYKFGTRPGEKGSAVIAGHYGRWNNGEYTVFNELKKLSKGDVVYIEDNRGVTTTFAVRKLKIYAPNDNAKEVFQSSDKKAHLNLITCEGTWDKSEQTYSHRLVLFTDKQEQGAKIF